ncbi:hypothetical protein AB0F71_06415 [Kitasatospora sp. NPDC028055]|uniref:hypothetical protein n=1 Tax=Kitasatospora sp. NPDC028055 TaxID=3155653 RepID=UPI0033C6ECC9
MGDIAYDRAVTTVKAALARELKIPLEAVQLEARLAAMGLNADRIRRVAAVVEAELDIDLDTTGITTGDTFVLAVVAAG